MMEKTLTSELVFKGKFLKIIRDKVMTRNNKTFFREYIHHPGASLVLAEDSDGKILLLKQYRHAQKQIYFELPAGKRDAGEDPLNTAHREFEEETGYKANRMDLMTELHPCIGYADEVIWLYHAQDLNFVGAKPDEAEDLEVLKMSWEEIEFKIKNHEIKDGKTLVSLLWYAQYIRPQRK